MELSQNPAATFNNYLFKRTFVINTHGELSPKYSLGFNSPCGVIFLTDIGKQFSTYTTIDDELVHPTIDRIIQETHIDIRHPVTGASILSKLCGLREVPEHNWVGDKQARIRGIPMECKFTGHKPGSLIPNNILFTGGGTALVNEGVYMSLDNGTQLDVSSHFGLIPIPLEPYARGPSRSNPDNFNLKKKALERLLRKNSKLSSLPKGSSLVGKEKRERDAFAKALKDYMFSIEGKVPIGKPYKFVRKDVKDVKDVNDDITLSDILGYASEIGFLNRDDLVIVSSCRVSDDSELVKYLKALVETNTGDVIGIGGGNNNRKYKGKKSVKSKYAKSRKNGRRTKFIKKTRRIIKRKYKK
jgi:hypothetical protein